MTNSTLAQGSLRAGRREWIGLGVLALPTLLVALDISVLFLALPHLSEDLGTSGTEQLWITDIYGFMLAGFLIPMGNLGDRIGRRKLLLIGAAAFGAASVLAAYAASPWTLIAARALLGVAGATLNPSTLALISNMFRDDKQRGVAISIWAACQFGGAAFGPILGGLVLDHFWWGAAFLMGVPVMLLLLVTGPILLPEYRNEQAGRLDMTSVALSLAAVIPVIFGIKELAAGNSETPTVALVALAVGLGFGWLFVRRQGRIESPLVDLGLFRQRVFSIALAAMTIGAGAFAGTSFLTSQYVQSVADLSPGESGLWLAPTGAGIAAGVLLSPIFLRFMSQLAAMVGGLVVSAVALLALTQVDADGDLVFVVVAIAFTAFGCGPLFALGTGLIVGSSPVEKAGAAASLSETSNLLGSTLGLALFGSLGAAVYRSDMGESLPAGVPEQAADAAKETLAGAVAVAGDLPQGADALVTAARVAFTDSLNVVAAVAGVIVAVLAVVMGVALRDKNKGGANQDAPEQAAQTEQAEQAAL
ncbi:MFS transporter [Streptomyces boluensis]|uniref:MFS transporter n=1 Tax=Streptomyces boluensis TaxID=1775135 RepID=A0A964XIE5_9ACTN|nr:MFS transporter [Streptomyces boluensis]NBE49960.1 MFS transporter [Streptomyces boluensis]